MSNIMMGIMAEMLAAHGAKMPTEEAPVEGGEGVLDALEAEAEETFAAVLAQNPVARAKAPEDALRPTVSVEQRSEATTNLTEQAPVRLDKLAAHSAPRIPFEAAALPKPSTPKDGGEAEPAETGFVTVSPENTNRLTANEDVPVGHQTTDRPESHAPTADTKSPVATPVVEAIRPPEHSVEAPTAESTPIQQRPNLNDTPMPAPVMDPIPAEAKPRDLPLQRPDRTDPVAQQMQVTNDAEHTGNPVEPPQERPDVTGPVQNSEKQDLDVQGPVSQATIGDPTIAVTAAQNATPREAAKSSQTRPDAPNTDRNPAKVTRGEETDVDAGGAAPQPTTPPAPTPSVEIVPFSAEAGPPNPKTGVVDSPRAPELSDDPRNGTDTSPPADLTGDSTPTPSPPTSAPPSTAQIPTPQTAAPTAVDLPQVDESGPTPSTTPPVPTERDVPSVAQQVAIAVSKSEGGTIELALRPVELGETQISMEFEAERLVITVATERSETQDLMRRQIDDLAREFRDLGYRDVSFRFEQQTGQQGQSRQAQDETQNANHAEIEPDLSPETPAPRPTYVSGRLDIRL